MKNDRVDRKKNLYQMANDSKRVVADEILFTNDKIFFDCLDDNDIDTIENNLNNIKSDDLER